MGPAELGRQVVSSSRGLADASEKGATTSSVPRVSIAASSRESSESKVERSLGREVLLRKTLKEGWAASTLVMTCEPLALSVLGDLRRFWGVRGGASAGGGDKVQSTMGWRAASWRTFGGQVELGLLVRFSCWDC